MLISGFDTADIETLTAAFEKKLKTGLPPQYRRFLLKYNGGETPNTDFHIGEVSSDLRALYGLGKADPHCHFDKLGRSLYGYLKQGMLPIGENAWGDTAALKLSGQGAGGVFFLYHDRTPRRFVPLTEDFAAFAAQCGSKPLGHIRSVEERAEGLKARGRTPTPDLEQFPEIMRKKEARARSAEQGGGCRRADARQGRQRSAAFPGPLNFSHYFWVLL